jgi:hypothetical protein
MDAPPQLARMSVRIRRQEQIARVANGGFCKKTTSTEILGGGGKEMKSY